MSSTFVPKKDQVHRRVPSRKRCLSQLQQPRQKELFQTIYPPFQKYFNSIPFESEYKGKVFRNNIQAYLQIFTYNYLVECFQIKNHQNSSMHLDYIYELIQKPQFEFLLPKRDSQLCTHTHMSLKNIISQFLNYLNTGIDPVMKSLNKYPLMLQIFTAFFRTLLALGQVCTYYEQPLQMQQTFQFLTSYFDLEVIIGDGYLYFTETNIYVCQKSPFEQYMFIPYDQLDISSFTNKRQEQLYKSGITTVNYLITGVQQESDVNMRKSRSQKRKKQAQVIIQKMQDRRMSIEKKFQSNNPLKNTNKDRSIIDTIQFSKTQLNYSDWKKSKVGQNKQNIPLILDQKKKNTMQTSCSQKNYQNNQQNNNILVEKQNIRLKEQKNDIKSQNHYRNKSQFNGLYEINKQDNQSKIKKNTSTENGKSTIKQKQKQKQKGSYIQGHFYRPEHLKFSTKIEKENTRVWVSKDISKQFTNSIILAQMPEPYRTNIKIKKQKARQIRKIAYNMIK